MSGYDDAVAVAVRIMAAKLYEDLGFAAPELWPLKIKVRMEDLADLIADIHDEFPAIGREIGSPEAQ